MFSILKIKKVKRVCPKRIIKGQNKEKISKRLKYEPQKEIKMDHESVQIQMPLPLLYFVK